MDDDNYDGTDDEEEDCMDSELESIHIKLPGI
jgi:hypothetical protein